MHGRRRAGPAGRDVQRDARRAGQRRSQAQRNLVADASHELRTPIASIRANLQLMRDEELLCTGGPRGAARRRDRGARRADRAGRRRGRAGPRHQAERPSPARCASTRSSPRRCERARRRAPQLDRSPARWSRRSCAARASGSRARSPTCSTTRPSGAPRRRDVEVALRDGVLTVRDHGPGFNERGPAVRVRPLPPGQRRALQAGLGAGAGDRPPGRRGPRRLRGGRQRARRRGADAGQLRPTLELSHAPEDAVSPS